MSCRVECGCPRCREEVYKLSRLRYDYDRYRFNPSLLPPYGVSPAMAIFQDQSETINRALAQIGEKIMEPKVTSEKPLDPTIKTVLERRRVVQSSLDNQLQIVKNYEAKITEAKALLMTYAPSIASLKAEVAALSKGLKKLGHAE